MASDAELSAVGRQTPAQGVLPTFDGSTILWCTVCADARGDWCAQAKVMALLQEIWAEPNQAWLVGDFLLMPDHVNFFASPRDETSAWVDVERWTAYWKDCFAKRCGQPMWRWQRGLFHHRLRSEQAYVEKGVYMRNNPVRAGLVKDAEEWLWQGRVHLLRW